MNGHPQEHPIVPDFGLFNDEFQYAFEHLVLSFKGSMQSPAQVLQDKKSAFGFGAKHDTVRVTHVSGCLVEFGATVTDVLYGLRDAVVCAH